MNSITCPRCGIQTTWEGNKFRPFCGETCQLQDLGKWATEEYRLASEDAADQAMVGSRPDEE